MLKGGRVIDPSQNIDGEMDILARGGKIAEVSRDIPSPRNCEIIDVRGRIVTPGLIDIHCHVAGSIVPAITVDPDVAGVIQGVTTVVDAGSTGEAIFGGIPGYVVPTSLTRFFCFLNLSSTGLAVIPELRGYEEVNPDGIASVISSSKGLIKGLKLRLVGNLLARDGVKVMEMAKKIAGQFKMPMMVHIGDLRKQVSATLTREILPLMEQGDILSHIYTAKFGSLLSSHGAVLREARDAAQRGVVMDTALGVNNFNFEVACRCLSQGFLPTTLSTDLGPVNLKHSVYGMTVTMTKFLALGLDLKQVVEMSTTNPARALGVGDHIGSLKPGMEADISVLTENPGRWILEDSEHQTLEVRSLIAPYLTLKAGEIIKAKPASQPKPVEVAPK